MNFVKKCTKRGEKQLIEKNARTFFFFLEDVIIFDEKYNTV